MPAPTAYRGSSQVVVRETQTAQAKQQLVLASVTKMIVPRRCGRAARRGFRFARQSLRLRAILLAGLARHGRRLARFAEIRCSTLLRSSHAFWRFARSDAASRKPPNKLSLGATPTLNPLMAQKAPPALDCR